MKIRKEENKKIFSTIQIWHYCPDTWKSEGLSNAGQRGANVTNSKLAAAIAAGRSFNSTLAT